MNPNERDRTRILPTTNNPQIVHQEQSKDGIVIASKPGGMGSAALVSRLKRDAGVKKAGHGGTLDRFADGLMLLFTGKATPFADFFLHKDKSYIATVRAGISTDTLDPEGTITDSVSDQLIDTFLRERGSEIRDAVESMTALKSQLPPDYSALKLGGKRASDRIRSGETINLKERPITVYSASLQEINLHQMTFRFEVRVSGGTYIRALVRDLGTELSFPMHLEGLTRTSIDTFRLTDATTWIPGEGEPIIQNPADILDTWPRIIVESTEDLQRLSHGNRVVIPGLPPGGTHFFLMDSRNNLLAWCISTGDGYMNRRVFVG